MAHFKAGIRTVKRIQNRPSRLRSLTAVVLMLWCAGTGCVLVSYARAATTNNRHAVAADAKAPSLSGIQAGAGSRSSCHAAHTRLKAQKSNSGFGAAAIEQLPLPTTPGAMSCCPLAGGSIVTTSRPQANDEQTIASADNSLTHFSISSLHPTPLVVPHRLRNQNQIYLRGCVFLI